MRLQQLHDWNVSPTDARRLQDEWRLRVDVTPAYTLPPNGILAAADVSYNRGSNRIFAAIVLTRPDTGEALGTVGAVADTTFPYIPGYLTFREGPALLAAFAKLETAPDAVLCDGQGIAHPRHMGIASHLGLFLDLPTVGCAKSRLAGTHDEVPPTAGATVPLMLRGEQVGIVLRTRLRANPLYISPGHRIDLASSLALVQRCLGKLRLPEPARLAHEAVNDRRRNASDQ